MIKEISKIQYALLSHFIYLLELLQILEERNQYQFSPLSSSALQLLMGVKFDHSSLYNMLCNTISEHLLKMQNCHRISKNNSPVPNLACFINKRILMRNTNLACLHVKLNYKLFPLKVMSNDCPETVGSHLWN